MRNRRITEADLDAIGGEPAVGEVWWCRGESLRFEDGGKVRPVLVVDVRSTTASIVPLTTRKPSAGAVGIAHAGGHSWLTHADIDVDRVDLISGLGAWAGFDAWRRVRR